MKHIFTVLFVCLVLSAYSQSVIYVTPTGAGNQSGGSWSDALPGLQLQGRLASAASGAQFWIASGRYSPGVLRTETFLIPSGVQVYGGFAGNETQLTDRVLSQPSSTTFTGETGDPAIIGDNNRHVVTFRNASASTRLDGVVITGGNADGSTSNDGMGGGIYNNGAEAGSRSDPSITHCWLIGNLAKLGGGGLFNDAANQGSTQPSLEHCRFEGNRADAPGGGVYGQTNGGTCSPAFRFCTFVNNRASFGGGVYFTASIAGGQSHPLFTSCTFERNVAFGDGGGASFQSGFAAYVNPVFLNCLFDANAAIERGGAVQTSGIINCDVNPTFTNCTLINNSANRSGSALYGRITSDSYSTYRLTNCVLRNNIIAYSTEANTKPPTYNVTYSNIQGGFAGTGNVDADPQFVDAANGNYRLLSSSSSVNTGDPNSTTASVSATDLAGNPRVQQNRIDMGAYEFQGGTEIYTVMDGNWNIPSVWSVNRLPTAGERIQLRHRVTLPAAYQAQAGRLGYDAGGQLIYSAGASLRLTP